MSPKQESHTGLKKEEEKREEEEEEEGEEGEQMYVFFFMESSVFWMSRVIGVIAKVLVERSHKPLIC